MLVRFLKLISLSAMLVAASSCTLIKPMTCSMKMCAPKPAATVMSASLQPGDFVAVCGDSITEQKIYSVMIADYMLMCQPAAGLRVLQAGWSGEQAVNFKDRMAVDVLSSKPTVATTCYGMNDGWYMPLSADAAQRYRDSQRESIRKFKQAGVHFIVVGSPGCVDSDMFRTGPKDSEMYNKTLAQLGDIAREVAKEEGVSFADLHNPMFAMMAQAKAKYGKTYHLAGGDGIHPDQNGQLVMAYAFLKALGCRGEVGTISMDLTGAGAEASAGHKVLSSAGGAVEIESTRYPFCFFGVDSSLPSSTRGVLEFLPFNQELNRFNLVVKHAAPERQYKVNWGTATKVFSGQQLLGGINLAAEFLDNPFCGPFQRVDAAVRAQQEFETLMTKVLLHDMPQYKTLAPGEVKSLDRIARDVQKHDKELAAVSAAAVTPVRHTIKIEAVN